MLVPDPATFRILPWADRTGWMLCDVYFGNGQPMPLDGRGLLRRVLSSLGDAGYDFLAGIEVEFCSSTPRRWRPSRRRPSTATSGSGPTRSPRTG
jgi:glutamine synthetase